jgi:hypothetical protein
VSISQPPAAANANPSPLHALATRPANNETMPRPGGSTRIRKNPHRDRSHQPPPRKTRFSPHPPQANPAQRRRPANRHAGNRPRKPAGNSAAKIPDKTPNVSAEKNSHRPRCIANYCAPAAPARSRRSNFAPGFVFEADFARGGGASSSVSYARLVEARGRPAASARAGKHQREGRRASRLLPQHGCRPRQAAEM